MKNQNSDAVSDMLRQKLILKRPDFFFTTELHGGNTELHGVYNPYFSSVLIRDIRG